MRVGFALHKPAFDAASTLLKIRSSSYPGSYVRFTPKVDGVNPVFKGQICICIGYEDIP